MPLTTRSARPRWLLLALAILPLADRPAYACGPDLPVAMLQRGHGGLCTNPSLRFASALAQLIPQDLQLRVVDTPTAEAEAADLRAALLAASVPVEHIDARIASVAAYRAQFETPTRSDEPPLALPDLPDEFRLYLLGARAWHRGDRDQAERHFEAVLALPSARRRFRSTWAAYMLARNDAWLGDRCLATDRAFTKVRELAAAGFHDSLGLAAASIGQQGQCWYHAGDTTRALGIYLEQLATGDATAQDSIDLTLAARFTAVAEGRADLDELARHDRLRELVGPWLVGDTRAQLEWSTLWLAALEHARVEHAVAAGPLAWAAYRTGEMDVAARWARLGARDLDHGDPLARWVLAKLELRNGDIEAAAAALARTELEFTLTLDHEPELRVVEWRYDSGGEAKASAATELGVLELRRDRFIPAFEAFVRGDSYIDAAYVAEQLLTFDELGDVLERFDAGPAATDRPSDFSFDHRLRWLHARRLARAGQWHRALPHYPDEWRAEAEAQAKDLDALEDPALANIERARLLWRVAQRTRSHGMELQGTELDPDWTIYDGHFSQPSIWSSRSEDQSATGPSEAERARYFANLLGQEPLRRFHYRWEAAEYAWQAAELLPDHHPATARVLCIAGGWIADRDPAGAEPFYRDMVRRNRAVDIAQWADSARWFPDPEQCSLRGIDFAQAGVQLPSRPPPQKKFSRRELARKAWPLAALFGLFALAGFLLIPTRPKDRPRAP